MEARKVLIRDENKSDFRDISDVTKLAFESMEISSHTEHFIIDALRDANALTISLVAEVEDRILGHIAFSPVTLSDGTLNWYGLGPVSVHPDFQKRGIGKALIQEGLSRLKDFRAKGCCLVGHPEYYRQFGFENSEKLFHEGIPPEVFFTLLFEGETPQGSVMFHDGFKADGQ